MCYALHLSDLRRYSWDVPAVGRTALVYSSAPFSNVKKTEHVVERPKIQVVWPAARAALRNRGLKGMQVVKVALIWRTSLIWILEEMMMRDVNSNESEDAGEKGPTRGFPG
eukprot:s523_g8.t1